MSNGVIDLRGSPTGLEGLGAALAQLFKDPNDRIRAYFLENEEAGAQIAEASREQSRRLQRGEGISAAQATALGDARIPTETLSLPALPGGGLVPPEILAELLERHPETPEMKRVREVGEGVRREVSLEEEIGLETARVRAAGIPSLRLVAENEAVSPQEWGEIFRGTLGADQAEAELREYQAKFGLNFERARADAGMTPTLLGEQAYKNFLLEGKRLEFTGQELEISQRHLDMYFEVFDSLSPNQQTTFAAGSMPGSQGLIQALLMDMSYDNQAAVSSIANARSTEEVLMERAEHRIRLQNAMDEDIVKLNAAVEGENQGRIEELASRLITNTRDLMAIDPQAGFPQAEILENLFGGISGVEFSLGDILSTGQLDGWYSVLAHQYVREVTGEGFTHPRENLRAAETKLNDALKDPLTGAINQKELTFVMGLIESLQTGGFQAKEAEASRRAAQDAEILLAEGGSALAQRQAQMEQELQDALLLLNSTLDPETGATTDFRSANALLWRIRYLRQRNFFTKPKTTEIPNISLR